MVRQTQTDELLADAEAAHATSDPERAELIARSRRFKASWYELGEALTLVRREERYRPWGYGSFEEYCRRELHLRAETADKLTGSFAFLRARAPEVLTRDGRDSPIPSYQAIDFLRRAEEASPTADEGTMAELRRHVLDEGASLPKISRLYKQTLFPVAAGEQEDRRRAALKSAVDRVLQLLTEVREAGTVPKALAAEVEEPLARLASALA